jgi:ADP-dependent NAD(P)H-hydrate dehydratase
MLGRPDEVTPALLRDWPLPEAGNSKYDRGRILVVGGAAQTPGAVQLAGLAALRVGAGHLTMAVAASASVALAVAVPEAGVVGLPENDRGVVLGNDLGAIADDLGSADVVIVGPGLDDAEQTTTLVGQLLPNLNDHAWLVLDAYALSALPALREALEPATGRMVLTPNGREAEILLGRELQDPHVDVPEIAERYAAVVSSQGIIADPAGARWQVSAGHDGLATSGSGDVLAGALGGLLGRHADGAQSAVWATYIHAAAGDRLAARVGRLGFLAREILDELPGILVELET